MPWLRLLRLPNLFTAPGDSLAGCFLTTVFLKKHPAPSPNTIAILAITSVLAYAFGILLNDVADYREDCLNRPERPLPSGRIKRPHAMFVCIILGVLSLLIPFLWLGATVAAFATALLLSILLYNLRFKRFRLVGSLAMGLCRGLNFLLGVTATGYATSFGKIWPVFVPFIAIIAYIVTVTWLADKENEEQNVGFVVQIPAIATALAWFGTILPLPQKTAALAIPAIFLILTVFLLEQTAGKLYHKTVPPKDMQKAIGAMLRPLVFWQVTWVLFSTATAAYVVAALLVAGWFCAKALSKAIAQS